MNKKGLSTIIVTLIIVLLSLVAVGIIWAVVSRLLLNNTKGVSLDKFTINGEIENVRINESVNNVSLTVARKSGGGELEGMKFVFEGTSGNEVVTEHFSLNQLESKKFNFHLNMNVSLIKKISIIPLFESDSREVVGNAISVYNFGGSSGGSSSGGTTTPCIPNCVGKNCGDDGCGESCGTCGTGYDCIGGTCLLNVTGITCEATGSHKCWYVDNAVSGTNNGSDWTNAWQSLSSINWASVNAGDYVYVSGGNINQVYNEMISVSKSGTLSNRIYITKGKDAGHNGEIIINGQASLAQCGLINGDYITISGFSCENTTSEGFRINGDYGIIENNIIRSISGTGISIHDCNGCIVSGNKITTYDNIPVQTDGITAYDAFNIIVEKNWIKATNQNDCSSCHNDGVQGSRDTNFTVRYNYIENTKNATGNAQGIYATEMHGIVKYYGNIIVLPYGPQAVTNANLGAGASQSYIINNIIKCGGYRCVYVNNDSSSVIKNNIIWQTGTGDAIYLREGSLANADINNNIIYAPLGGLNVFQINASYYNWTYWRNLGFDLNGNNINPNLDICLRTQSSSFIGETLTNGYGYALNFSLCGTNGVGSFLPVTLTPRTVSWDVGAYEYS